MRRKRRRRIGDRNDLTRSWECSDRRNDISTSHDLSQQRECVCVSERERERDRERETETERGRQRERQRER
jgi:hypothetical protein